MQNIIQKQIIKASNLINLISSQELQPFIDKYKADFSANKLYVLIFLKLFLYSWILDRDNLSLESISQNSKSSVFQQLAHLDSNFSVVKSSLSDRLTKIPHQLFKELFENLAEKTLKNLPDQQKYSKSVNQLIKQAKILDSTVITLSSKLLKTGYRINPNQLTFKASMAIQGRQIPVKALVLDDKTDFSEDKALPKLFDFSKKNVIYIFDRGIQKLQTYADIIESGNHFVSRPTVEKYQVISTNKLPDNPETETLIIIKDEIITPTKLKNEKIKLRLISAVSKKDNKTLQFITDLIDLEAVDITELYHYRWSIEIFFRYLKSELHLESLLSYSENGTKVHIYLALITFLLTWIYKEQNNIKSFKRARRQLKLDLLEILIKKEFQQGFIAGMTSKKLRNPL